MQTQSTQKMEPGARQCIGCADCKGLCLDLLELAFVPEAVLKAAAISR